MNTGQKIFALAVAAFLVGGLAAVATASAGTPDAEYDTEDAESIDVEMIETDGDNGTFEAGVATFEVNQSGEVEVTNERTDEQDGEADHYHVPVEAVDDPRYDHDFDASEYHLTEFAGKEGYVVEAEKVDTRDDSVVAHVAENDPEIDGIFHGEDLEKTQFDKDEVVKSEDRDSIVVETGE